MQALPLSWHGVEGCVPDESAKAWLRTRVLVTRYNGMQYRGIDLTSLTVDSEMLKVCPVFENRHRPHVHESLLHLSVALSLLALPRPSSRSFCLLCEAPQMLTKLYAHLRGWCVLCRAQGAAFNRPAAAKRMKTNVATAVTPDGTTFRSYFRFDCLSQSTLLVTTLLCHVTHI